MRFRRVALADAGGHILGHNVSHQGRRLLKKGRPLGELELGQLAAAGQGFVHVAELDATDVGEDVAALRIATVLRQAGGLCAVPAYGGRVSLRAPEHGLLSVRAELLLELNLVDGVTLACLPSHSVVAAGQPLATLKVIPFALPEATVVAAERVCARGVLSLRPLPRRRVCILVSGAEGRRARLFEAYRVPLEQRLSGLGAHAVSAEYVALDADPEAELGVAIKRQLDAAVDLLIVVGETATMDRDDLAPRAIRRAGGEVLVVGAPVFPGNLLLLGYRGGSAILGAPGCVRSPARNVVDLILPRLLLGERLGQRDVAELGLGGLLGGSQEASGTPGDGDG